MTAGRGDPHGGGSLMMLRSARGEAGSQPRGGTYRLCWRRSGASSHPSPAPRRRARRRRRSGPRSLLGEQYGQPGNVGAPVGQGSRGRPARGVRHAGEPVLRPLLRDLPWGEGLQRPPGKQSRSLRPALAGQRLDTACQPAPAVQARRRHGAGSVRGFQRDPDPQLARPAPELERRAPELRRRALAARVTTAPPRARS